MDLWQELKALIPVRCAKAHSGSARITLPNPGVARPMLRKPAIAAARECLALPIIRAIMIPPRRCRINIGRSSIRMGGGTERGAGKLLVRAQPSLARRALTLRSILAPQRGARVSYPPPAAVIQRGCRAATWTSVIGNALQP